MGSCGRRQVGSGLAQLGEPQIDRGQGPYYTISNYVGLRVQSLRAQSFQRTRRRSLRREALGNLAQHDVHQIKNSPTSAVLR